MTPNSAIVNELCLATFKVDYASLFPPESKSAQARVTAIVSELPYVWRNSYVSAGSRATSITRIQSGAFEYVYDYYSYLEKTQVVAYNPTFEDRLVVAFGKSAPIPKCRDDYRLRGWVGPTNKTFGARYDKGHFIAHSIGGAVDRSEINVFVQRRDLNRGWSVEGKRYRAMEQYCVQHPGVFCFSRPIYDDQTSKPAFLEFGVIKESGELWVECFDNR